MDITPFDVDQGIDGLVVAGLLRHAERAMPHRLPKLKILVADPSPTMADLLVASLRGVGVREIARVLDSQAAERLLSVQRLDAAVIGFELKPKGIAELVVNLRRSRQINAHMPVIGIAGSPNERDLAQAMLAGVNKVLRLPISAEALRVRLLALLTDGPDDSGAFQEI